MGSLGIYTITYATLAEIREASRGIETMNNPLSSDADGEAPEGISAAEHSRAAATRWAMSFACAPDITSLSQSFEQAANALGFHHYAISRVTRPRSVTYVQTHLELISVHYPAAWVRHYVRHDYASSDPVHRTALTRTVPYRWQDITGLRPAERRILDEAQDAGLAAGLSIPIHQPDGSIVLFNFSGSAHAVDAALETRSAYCVSTLIHLELTRLAALPSQRSAHYLSGRQIECLEWVARGKTSRDISLIVGIAHHTVDHHLKLAMERLGVHNRTAAAVKASALGLVRP